MRRWGLFAVAALAACYHAPRSDEACTITCSLDGGACPGDLVCEGGFCVGPGQVCRPAFAHVAAGTGDGCGIDGDGALWCWGALSGPAATRIDTSRHWQSIDGGGATLCGIADDRLYCWSPAAPAPAEIEATSGPAAWTAVSVGARSTCAIGDGRMWCWGANEAGQLGDGTRLDRATPGPIASSITDWTAVSIGSRHTCAISQSAGVYCWGASATGQVGPNATAMPQLTPVDVGVMATSIATSGAATCATTPAGELVCWGSNSYGELGEANQALTQSTTPVTATASTGWTQVAAGEDALCGLRAGEVVCWGATTLGGLGNGFWTQAPSTHAFGAVPGTQGASELALGWNERVDEVAMSDARDLTLACAVVGSDIACWGDNRFGQLGTGAATMALAPTDVAGSHAFSDLEVGLAHGCGIAGDAVWCWGSTELGAASGVLAGGATKACDPTLDCDIGAPKALNFFANASAVAAGAYHSCAFHAGAITCWGDNSANQLLTTTPAPPRERDIPAPGGAMWTDLVQTGRLGQCGRYRSGSADATACWGNVFGAHSTVTPLPMLDTATGFALGSTPNATNYDCLLDAAGTLMCQGDNSVGEYGSGGTYTAIATNALSPTVCGIKPDTSVECWGMNDRGQTGASGLTGCTRIAVGRWHACAACGDALWCWGDNRFGQLGTGRLDPDPQPPQQVAWSGPVDQLVAGYRFTCARSGTRVACWGFDPHAALGNGGRSANLPVLVTARPAQ